jgi:2-iminobutanoate/2-iminopropanoate deaminase
VSALLLLHGAGAPCAKGLGISAMNRRRSIDIEGFHHGPQPIPAACRVGTAIMTSGIYGLDTTNGRIPDDVVEQTRLMFANLKRVLEAGGSSLDDVIKMTVYVKMPEARIAINEEWLKAFPDTRSRPARHTFQNDNLPANLAVQCDVTAIIDLEAG